MVGTIVLSGRFPDAYLLNLAPHSTIVGWEWSQSTHVDYSNHEYIDASTGQGICCCSISGNPIFDTRYKRTDADNDTYQNTLVPDNFPLRCISRDFYKFWKVKVGP